MNKKGIDISEWNKGKIDWPVAAKNIDFAILREGCRERADYAFFEYVQSCKKYNVPIEGVYHFIYATDNQKVLEEAESCLKNIQKAGLPKSTYVWCDFEYDTVKKAADKGVKLGPAECNLFTKTFCDFFKRKGYKAGIYTNCDYYKNWYSKSVLDAYPIWLADYSGGPDHPCLYHQYTSSGAVVGISGKVDMNYFIDDAKEETTMVRMSNCGHDENGRYSGGKAGDQSGTEWYLRPWYAYPWNYILRWKDRKLADLFADLSEEAAKNNLIGYDQNQRDTFWQHLKASNYRPSQITIACEADCSSGTIALIRAVGYIMGIKDLQNCNTMTYTGNMMTWFRSAAGKKYFDILTGKYLTDSSMAMRGDINLNTAHHVNITVDNGVNSGTSGNSESSGTAAKTKANLTKELKLKLPEISKGCTGTAVSMLQAMLGVSVDGDFGNTTDTTLKTFQGNVGLNKDGICGENTWKAVVEHMKANTFK